MGTVGFHHSQIVMEELVIFGLAHKFLLYRIKGIKSGRKSVFPVMKTSY